MTMKRTLAALAALVLVLAFAVALLAAGGARPALAQVTCPTTLPPATNFTAATTTQGQFKTNLTNLVAYLTCLLGTDGTTSTAKTTLGLATVATSGSYTDLSSKPSTISGPSSSTVSNVPQWSNVTGSALSSGLAVGTGANALLELNSSGQIPAVDAGLTHGHASFTSSGTHTIASTSEKVLVCGAGGGGGGADTTNTHDAGGGGSGSIGVKWFAGLTIGSTLTVTIGTGGSAGSSTGGDGGSGTGTSVSSGSQTITTISTNGGIGGQGNFGAGGAGGSAGSGGDINNPGQPGTTAVTLSGDRAGGSGGPGPFLGGGALGNASAGSNGGLCAGGGGGGTGGFTGGTGGAGFVLFEW